MTAQIERIERRRRAVELLRQGFRSTIVHYHVDLPLAELRALFREIHGHSPPRGPLPALASILESRPAEASATLFALLLADSETSTPGRRFDLKSLLATWAFFTDHVQQQRRPAPADVNEAWILARALHAGDVRLSTCRQCWMPYLLGIAKSWRSVCFRCR